MTYRDYYNFDQRYFEGKNVDDPHPAGYYYYPNEPLDYEQYASHIDSAVGSRKALVVGCAYGFAIRYLVNNHGWNRAYGMDVSDWVQQAKFGDVGDRIYQGDALNANRYGEIASDTAGPRRWDFIYSEYLLEHFTDEEAIQATQNMRDAADGMVVHRIWSGAEYDPEDWFNVKTVDEWIALVGDNPNEEWIDYDNPAASTI